VKKIEAAAKAAPNFGRLSSFAGMTKEESNLRVP